MKTLGAFINKKKLIRGKFIDQQSVFYVFQLIIKDEYGKRGIENITLVSFRDKRIFIKISNSNWRSEIQSRKKQIIAKINKELGEEEIIDLVINS